MVVHMSPAGRIPSFDGLRGIAALAVMAFHFNIFFLPQARLSNLVPYLGRAYLAVDLFFLLSGFVMAHVYGRALASDWRTHWRQFAIARLIRIYPSFALATLATIMIVGLSHISVVSFSRHSLWLQPFLLQQWAAGLTWDYPSWSISTEAEAYVFFVFAAALLLTGKHPLLIAATCIAVLGALSVADGGAINYFSGVPALLRTLAGFSLGVLLYRLQFHSTKPRCAIAASLIVLGVGLRAVTHLDFFMVLAFGCLIYYAVNARDPLCRLLNSDPSVALGNWSYAIYLWHAPVQFAVMAAFLAIGHPVSSLDLPRARLLLLATMLMVVGLSAIHYRYVEASLRRGLRLLMLGPDVGRAEFSK
jgi:peptidoglycan/LPS O-acetylase OafA/YrhL